jgi:hypothetical protein
MSKKRDFIQGQQSRDKHPDSGMVGSASEVERRGAASTNVDVTMDDKQAPHSGKSANDHNKQGEQAPTQKNEGRRTPQSRHDRESHIGGENQSQTRKGTPGAGRGKQGAG